MPTIDLLTTPDCKKCEKTKEMLRKIGDELGLSLAVNVVDITREPEYVLTYRVPMYAIPALVINGRLAFTGLPKEDKLRETIRRAV